MAKYDLALKKLQKKRLEVSSQIGNLDLLYRTTVDEDTNILIDLGYLSGLEKAEEILFELQKKNDENGQKLWYTGSPNDIKPNNRGSYILIMRSHFSSEDGINDGDIKIDCDFWNGEDWEGYEIGEGKWEVLYFTKLKWLLFPLPKELGVKRTDSLFFD